MSIIKSNIEYIPHGSISDFVQLVWFYPTSKEKVYEILPDGCIDVVFELFENYTSCLVFGTTTQKQRFALKSEADYFGIRFRPGMARYFLAFPANELTNNYLALGNFLGVISDQFLEVDSFTNRLALITNSMLNQVKSHNVKVAPIDYAVRLIQKNNGNVRLDYLSSQCNLSTKQLQRTFIKTIGVTPKTLCRIMRVRATINAITKLQPTKEVNLAELAFDMHYSDQSHMCRDFRLLTGYTPASFLTS